MEYRVRVASGESDEAFLESMTYESFLANYFPTWQRILGAGITNLVAKRLYGRLRDAPRDPSATTLNLVVENDDRDRVAGLSLSLRDPFFVYPEKLVWVNNIHVLPGYRRKGIGASLLREADDWARSLGVARVGLHTTEQNRDARRLYERHGYAVRSKRKSEYYYLKRL